MHVYKLFFSGLSVVLGLAACQTEPEGHSFTPTITVYAEKPATSATDKLSEAAPNHVPSGMVYVPGGLTQIGADDGQDWEKPMFWIAVKPFCSTNIR